MINKMLIEFKEECVKLHIMAYPFGLSFFLKVLDIIILKIEMLLNDHVDLLNKKVQRWKILFIPMYKLIYLGVSPLDHVLYPRSGAFVGAIKALKDKFDAVYDVTVMYNKTFDNDLRIRLPAPSMPGKKNTLVLMIKIKIS